MPKRKSSLFQKGNTLFRGKKLRKNMFEKGAVNSNKGGRAVDAGSAKSKGQGGRFKSRDKKPRGRAPGEGNDSAKGSDTGSPGTGGAEADVCAGPGPKQQRGRDKEPAIRLDPKGVHR